MSAIFITKTLQTMVKGPSRKNCGCTPRRRLWMYNEKKIVDVQREEDYIIIIIFGISTKNWHLMI